MKGVFEFGSWLVVALASKGCVLVWNAPFLVGRGG